MAKLIIGRTGQQVYASVLHQLRTYGSLKQSRNGDVLNLDDVLIELETPEHALPLHTGRNLNRKIAAAEALQLIGGFSDPAWLLELAPQFKRYAEEDPDGKPYFYGAYGPRIHRNGQLHFVLEKLRTDPDTRQAVLTLWDPARDTRPDHLDYPCTVAIGFSRRGAGGEYLDMRVTMRSNDAWLGLPYDLFQFAQLQLTVCNVLGLLPGTYVHGAWSLHLYLENLKASYEVAEPVVTGDNPTGIGRSVSSAAHLHSDALDLRHGRLVHLTESEQWYANVLKA